MVSSLDSSKQETAEAKMLSLHKPMGDFTQVDTQAAAHIFICVSLEFENLRVS